MLRFYPLCWLQSVYQYLLLSIQDPQSQTCQNHLIIIFQFHWTVHKQRTLIQFYNCNDFFLSNKSSRLQEKNTPRCNYAKCCRHAQVHRWCDVGSTVQFLKLALVYLIKLFPETVGEAKAKFHCLQTYFNKEWAKVTWPGDRGQLHLQVGVFWRHEVFEEESDSPSIRLIPGGADSGGV